MLEVAPGAPLRLRADGSVMLDVERTLRTVLVIAVIAVSAEQAAMYLDWLHSWSALGIDFRTSTWNPGNAIRGGHSPYAAP